MKTVMMMIPMTQDVCWVQNCRATSWWRCKWRHSPSNHYPDDDRGHNHLKHFPLLSTGQDKTDPRIPGTQLSISFFNTAITFLDYDYKKYLTILAILDARFYIKRLIVAHFQTCIFYSGWYGKETKINMGQKHSNLKEMKCHLAQQTQCNWWTFILSVGQYKWVGPEV